MNYLVDALLFVAGFFTGFLIFKGHFKTKWSRWMRPESTRIEYRIEVEGERYQFTEHEIDSANERAGKFWR